jgi:uncharacterized small protein (DUF1192 family)
MKRKKRKSHLTPEEHEVRLQRQRALEERIRLLEAELKASGSVYAEVPPVERLSFAIERIEAELAAKKKSA